MASESPPGLQIHQHLGFQRRFLMFRRCGMAGLVLVLLAAVSGLFGSGPLASASASVGAVEVDYPRFLHRGHPAWFELRVGTGESPVEVVLDGDLVEAFDLDHMTPAPEQAVLEDGRLLLRLAPGTTAVRLELTPRSMGRAEGHVSTSGDRARVRMFVYP